MGMWLSEVSKNEIEDVINELNNDFHFLIKKELQIENVEYEIIMNAVSFKDEYPDPSIKAFAVANIEESQIEKVVFFTESISHNINHIFSKISNSIMFTDVVRIYIKFVFIHELVHVQQIKNGMSMEEYRATNYQDNKWEKQANDKAMELLSKEGEFQKKIIEILISSKPRSLDNDNVKELINLYNGESHINLE